MNRITRTFLAGTVATVVLSLTGAAPSVAASDETRVPGNVQNIGATSVLSDTTVVTTWRATNIIAGTTVVVKVKRCNGTWATTRVTGKTGTFKVTHAFPLSQRFPKLAPIEGVLLHPDHKRTTTDSGARLAFGNRYGKC